MSIKPPIKCPPDYSILCFRMTECKKAGIVKGINTQLAVDLQDFFVPVTNYEERQITLKAGQTKLIDVSSIGENTDLAESYEFVANANNCGNGTSHTYTLRDEGLNILGSFSFTVTSSGFANAFSTAYAGSNVKDFVSFDISAFTGVTGKIKVTATKKGIKYRHLFQFDTSGFGGYYPYPYEHPGNLITPAHRYDRPRVKLMMIYPDYYKANVLSNCGCLDTSGDMKSNKKYIEYAYADQYAEVTFPSTPITASPVLNADPLGADWTWDQSSADNFDYHFRVGDMLYASSDPLKRAFITEKDGYFFSVDTPIGDDTLTASQALTHVYSPSGVKWRKMGDFYLHTTGQDVVDTDRLYIESLWLRNPHSYDLPVKILLGS